MSTKIANLTIGIKNESKKASDQLRSLASALRTVDEAKNSLDFNSVSNRGSSGLQNLYRQVQSITRIMKPLAVEMEKISKGFDALGVKASTVIKNSGVGALKDSTKALSTKTAKLSEQTATVTERTGITPASIDAMSSSIISFEGNVSHLIAQLYLLRKAYNDAIVGSDRDSNEAKILSTRIYRTEEAISKAQGLSNANQRLAQSNNVVSSSSERVANSTKRASSNTLKLSSITHTVSNLARKAGAGFRSLASSLQKLASRFSLSNTGIGKFVSQLGRLTRLKGMRMLVMAFYKAIGDGIKNLYAYSRALDSADGSHFASTMDSYANMALKLKNTIATTLAPVISAILPFLQKLSAYIIQAANAIARFFAILNGQSTFTVAKDVATQFQDLDDAVGSANSSAKELQKTILGFDELNVLNSPDTSGGSGGGGGASGIDASDMFEELPTGELEGVWAKLAEWGATLKRDAELIWGWVKNIFGKLENAGVFDKIIEFVDDIVLTIDGFIAEMDNGGSLDRIVNFVSHLLDDVRNIWEIIKKIVDALAEHGVFDTILSIAEDIESAIHDTLEDIKNSDAIDTVASIVATMFSHIQTIWEIVKKTVESLENNGVFKKILEIVEDVQDTIGDILGRLNSDTSINKIAGIISSLLDDVKKIWGWVDDIINTLLDTGVFGSILDTVEEIVGYLSELIDKLDSDGTITEIANSVGEILKGLKEIWESDFVKAITSTTFANTSKILDGHLKLINDILKLVADIMKGDFKSVFSDLAMSVVRAFTLIFQSLTTQIDAILNGLGADSDLTGYLGYKADAFEHLAKDGIESWDKYSEYVENNIPSYTDYMNSGKPNFDPDNPYVNLYPFGGDEKSTTGFSQLEYLENLRKEYFSMGEFAKSWEIEAIINTDLAEEELNALARYYEMLKGYLESDYIITYISKEYGVASLEDLYLEYGLTKSDIENDAIVAYVQNTYGVESVQELLEQWGFTKEQIENIVPYIAISDKDALEGLGEINDKTAEATQNMLDWADASLDWGSIMETAGYDASTALSEVLDGTETNYEAYIKLKDYLAKNPLYYESDKKAYEVLSTQFSDLLMEYADVASEIGENPFEFKSNHEQVSKTLGEIIKEYDGDLLHIGQNWFEFRGDSDDVMKRLRLILQRYYDVSDDISENEISPQVNSAEAEKEFNNIGKKWDTTTLKEKAPSIDPIYANQQINNIMNKWKGTQLVEKTLPVSNSDANSKITATTGKWNNTSFSSKSLSVSTGKATDAMDGVRNYWNNLSFSSKGINVKVNLPKGTSVEYYASGGYPDYGSVFIAGEQGAGAEMVGNINGRTGVASQGEITGIRESVEATGNAEARLLAEQNALLRQILAKEGNVSLSTMSIVNGFNRVNRRTGKTVVTMG